MHASTREGGAAGYVGIGVAAALATAGLVYLFDPNSGNRRRALMRDKLHHAQRESRQFMGKAKRDAAHRVQGVYREAANRIQRRAVDDTTLEQRVRSTLGRLTSHPRAIQVECRDGIVCLRGDVLQHEAEAVVRGVARVRGVYDVDDRLLRHSRANGISSLQGEGRHRTLHRVEYLQSNWSPAPRVAAGAAAMTMVLGALGRRSPSPLAYALAAGGAVLLARAIANVPLRELLGAPSSAEHADEGLVEFEKTFEVYADIEDVYDTWRDVERWPRFMNHVRDIQRIDDTTYRFVVDGPAGVPIEYESEITADVRDEMIAWRTTDGSAVHNSGVVQFEPSEDGGTRVHLRMGYRPPAGALGHAVAKLFRRDPKRQMDDDISRFKAFLEMDMPPRDAARGEESRGRRERREEPAWREEGAPREDSGRVWH